MCLSWLSVLRDILSAKGIYGLCVPQAAACNAYRDGDPSTHTFAFAVGAGDNPLGVCGAPPTALRTIFVQRRHRSPSGIGHWAFINRNDKKQLLLDRANRDPAARRAAPRFPHGPVARAGHPERRHRGRAYPSAFLPQRHLRHLPGAAGGGRSADAQGPCAFGGGNRSRVRACLPVASAQQTGRTGLRM